MGMLVKGRWQDEDLKDFLRDGNTVRFDSGFSGQIESSPDAQFPAAVDRYALYMNWTCPWSHRASATRALKGLESVIDIVLLEPSMGRQSWWFGNSSEFSDPALGATHLHELYSASRADFTGRVSVPVLWDKHSAQIVSNDSGAIARMFNCEFNAFASNAVVDLYPEALRDEIDTLNEYVADELNDGVYRCLLAKSQDDYEAGYERIFAALDSLEARLSMQRYLLGDAPTEPDWRLFACLVRFDAVYYSLFKCNQQRIVDYASLWDYTRDLYQLPGIAATVDINTIKRGYFGMIHRKGFVPKGPALDFQAPHSRAELMTGN